MEKKDLKTDMHKMVRMSTEKCESLFFYKYLCQKIGSKEVVKIRRLTSTILGLGAINPTIISGSKGEGLYFHTSDFDIMFIDPLFKVYDSEKEVVFDGLTIPLIMNTDETQPCFTQLCLPNYYCVSKPFKDMFQKNHLGCMLSSEQYRLHALTTVSDKNLEAATLFFKIHGPCVSDVNESCDIAFCLNCDQWIFQANPWLRRSHTTWPPPEIISKIITYGVLFVLMGCKGSDNENLEWRISFSAAEKFLIFSFSHTQLLCYALLKILLKEIVEKNAKLKGLLCSYFLKTLMFWISEETDVNSWRADNIIPCFKACLKRLIYCVKYAILPHYFIPDNNFFYTRFNVMNKEHLTTVLENLYKQGINCFASSETLQDYKSLSCNIHESLLNGKIGILLEEPFSYSITCTQNTCLLYHFLHHSRSSLSRGLLALYFSKACMFARDASYCCYSSENKLQYFKYKYDLSHLLIGVNSDAVSGWMRLASFFYVRKNYFASLSVINYSLQKYTDENMCTGIISCLFEEEPKYLKNNELNLMKKENFYTIYKTLNISPLVFTHITSIIPQELQLRLKCYVYDPLEFGLFLSFLCHYHLSDITSCTHYLQQIRSRIKYNDNRNMHLAIFSAIGYQLLGEINVAREMFQLVAEADFYNHTGALTRLKLLSDI